MHDRLIPLDRVLNFRDFGGWDAGDGARIARAKLYRSAAFHDASEADIAKLDTLGIAVCADLRRPEERRHEPNKWPGGACRVILNDEGNADALPPHLLALMQSDLTAASITRFMHELYRAFAFDPRHIKLYREWFAALGEHEGGAVIHCAAGKDRTGLGCALTLIALGAPEEAVFADYEFTNAAIDLDARLPRLHARMEERLGKKLDPQALRPMMGVHVDYLRDALNAIDARYGSALNYMEQALGVGARERAALRRKFVV